jgi:FAD/FMN-containing dehydrogenase
MTVVTQTSNKATDSNLDARSHSSVRPTAGSTPISPTAVSALRKRIRGAVLTAADEGYDAARQVWNAMIDRRPGVIARCTDAGDVQTVVDFARDVNALLSVRGGGHNIAGSAVNDGGVVLDLSLMKSVQVDPVVRTARVAPGATLGELDRETQAFGLITPNGDQFDHWYRRPYARRRIWLD